VPWPFYERPELTIQEGIYLSAWYDLSTERPIGMAEGPIPRSKIKDYGTDDLGLIGDELELFVSIMCRVDGGYLSNENEVNKSDPNSHIREEVSINNAAGVKNILSRLGAAAAGAGKDRFRKSGKPHARKRHRPDNNNPA
jgi:hypothetical protein